MGAKSSIIYKEMLIIGGCELSLERNPITQIDRLYFENDCVVVERHQ